jgi:hypothetical protein
MFLSQWFKVDTHHYDLINGDKTDNRSERRPFRDTIWITILQMLVAISIIAVSFSLGWYLHPTPSGKLLDSKFIFMSALRGIPKLIYYQGKTDFLFRYNRTFGEPPSEVTNAAWESLFPKHGGFFVHPDLAPERSAFSVFHQLHCLVSQSNQRCAVWASRSNITG